MVASSDGRDRRHVSCDAHLNKVRTDTRVVFNKHDAHTMRVWHQHIDATLDQKGLLNAAKHPTASFRLTTRPRLVPAQRTKTNLRPNQLLFHFLKMRSASKLFECSLEPLRTRTASTTTLCTVTLLGNL